MRWLLILGGVAVTMILILIIALGSDKSPSKSSLLAPDAGTKKASHNEQETDPSSNVPNVGAASFAKPGSMEDKHEQRTEPVHEGTVMQFGKEFEQKWRKDKDRLGPERHQEMEKLWFEGRRPRGKADSIAKLERLLRDFPDTNRAGCAAYELGQHYLHLSTVPMEERRGKAETYLRMAQERYQESLCEYNEAAAPMAEIAMAQWIYRFSDPGMARRMLQDVMQRYPNETDHLGQPLSVLAQRLLESLK